MSAWLAVLLLAAPPDAKRAEALAAAKEWEELYLAFATAKPAQYGAADQKKIGAALKTGCEALLPTDGVMAYSLGEQGVAFGAGSDALLCTALGAKKSDQRGAAQEALERGVTRFASEPRFALELGRLLLEEHDASGALAALSKVPASSKSAAEARTLEAQARPLAQEDSKAKAELGRQVKALEQKQAAPEGPPPPPPLEVRSGSYESTTDAEGRRVRQNERFRFRYFNGQRDFGQRADYEGAVQAALEDARATATRLLGVTRERAVDVILYSREEFALHHGERAARAVAGFYSQSAIRMNDSADITPAVQLTLVHEYVHAVVDELAGFQTEGVPVWLNEGLAEYISWRAQGYDHAPVAPRAALRTLAQAKKLPTLSQLRDGPLIGAKDPSMAYALAGSAVALLVSERGLPEVLELIRDVGQGQAFDSAFERRTGKDLARFEEEVLANLRSR